MRTLTHLPLNLRERDHKRGGEMGKEIVRCKNGKDYRKENCPYPDYSCEACPELIKKSEPKNVKAQKTTGKKKTMETPNTFAEIYFKRLNGRGENEDIFLTRAYTSDLIVYESSNKTIEKLSEKLLKEDISKLKRSINLTSLNNLNIENDIKKRILITLHELTEVMNDNLSLLKKKNKEVVKQRRDTIKLLEETLKYIFLDRQACTVIQKEIERLREFDTNEQEYYSMMEIEFVDTINSKPAIGGLEFDLRKKKKLEEMLSIPLEKRTGRPFKFFSKALQKVIFTFLEGNGMPIEKAKQYSANIINEYWKKQGFTDIAILTAKDIENALHSTA